jgi:hypothetical protein
MRQALKKKKILKILVSMATLNATDQKFQK